ncbi:MAG: hypothetical protein HY360_20340, partial [Verrucomicrobia bacterium]|nr:hypothetical protein [Verrucomicrobiota bacterium]
VTRDGLLHQGSIQTAERWRPAPSELRGAWEAFGAVFADLKLNAEVEEAVSALATRKFATHEWNQHGKLRIENEA